MLNLYLGNVHSTMIGITTSTLSPPCLLPTTSIAISEKVKAYSENYIPPRAIMIIQISRPTAPRLEKRNKLR